MIKLTKGESTRLQIVDRAREIFNERGIGITIDQIAQEMGTTKSRISNHFPTKDSLFLAILRNYETELAVKLGGLQAPGFKQDMQSYIDGISEVMDIQFKYRCGIIYLNVLSPSQHELRHHIRENYERNLAGIRIRVTEWVKTGLLDASVLEEPAWSAFIFAYVNLLTQWVVHYDMYDYDKPYASNKATYLRGIMMHLHYPYLTAKGKRAFNVLKFPDMP